MPWNEATLNNAYENTIKRLAEMGIDNNVEKEEAKKHQAPHDLPKKQIEEGRENLQQPRVKR